MWPIFSSYIPLNRCINRSVPAPLTAFKNPSSCRPRMYDHPLNNTHTGPHSTATADPLWVIRLHQDGDKCAFITAMISPSSTREGEERKTLLVPFLPCLYYHVQGLLMHKGHKRTRYMLWIYNKYVHLYSLYSYIHTYTTWKKYVHLYCSFRNAHSNTVLQTKLHPKRLHTVAPT